MKWLQFIGAAGIFAKQSFMEVTTNTCMNFLPFAREDIFGAFI